MYNLYLVTSTTW